MLKGAVCFLIFWGIWDMSVIGSYVMNPEMGVFMAIISTLLAVCGVRIAFESGYRDWLTKLTGNHPYYAWKQALDMRRNALSEYDPSTCNMIRFNEFEKYFRLNPSRYGLMPGYVSFRSSDGDPEWRMMFLRRDMRRYHKFRLDWASSRHMAEVLECVQSDIDRARGEAEACLERSKAMLEKTPMGSVALDQVCQATAKPTGFGVVVG